ncbi:MAG: helix-turn-helix transcriptional regulator, partial [Cellulosilyticaceae bacterium]
MQFGDRLKALRKERKMTQRDLADCLNISDRVAGYYESNERFPKDAHTLTSIANVFNVSLD